MKNLDNVTNVWGKVDERRHEVLEVSVQGMRNRWPLGFPLVKFRNAAGEEYAHSFKDDMQSNKVRVELNDRDVKRAGVCVMTVEWHEKGRVVASREYMGLIEGKKMEKPKYEVIGGKEDCAGGNGGGGLPEGGEPNKQLVTDASGETVWEDRLAWKEERLHFIYDEWFEFCKISDEVPGVIPETIAITIASPDGTTENKDVRVVQSSDNAFLYQFWWVVIAKEDNATYSSDVTHIVFPEKGVYLLKQLDTGSYLAKATWDGHSYEWDGTFKNIKPIDPDLIGGWKALGEGEPVKTAIVENVSVTLADLGNGMYGVQEPLNITPVVGTTYFVTWDGTEYECVAYEIADAPGNGIIGNATLMGVAAGGNGEPFMIINMGGGAMLCGQDANTHTISVFANEVEIIPVPGNYLPLATEEAQGAIKVYNFPAKIVSADEMNAAVAEMNAGSARVFWAGDEVRNASVNGDVLTCNLGEKWQKTYTASSGKYSTSLWEYVATPACVNDFYMVNGSGKKFRITVQDDGTLSATEVT